MLGGRLVCRKIWRCLSLSFMVDLVLRKTNSFVALGDKHFDHFSLISLLISKLMAVEEFFL
jgi:hypothetical protein